MFICYFSPFYVYSTQTVQITLPENFTCYRCVLQLLRQAGEWVFNGGYVFWSCADISIIDNAGITIHWLLSLLVISPLVCDNNRCGGRGVCINGTCECNRGFSGKFCQYRGSTDSITKYGVLPY